MIQEWEYKYGDEKSLIVRRDASGNVNPEIIIHPTNNEILIRVSHFPITKTTPSSPTDGSNNIIKIFECSVPNIPLQSWFSLSLSISNRNMDIYINGKLIKSCVIPGVPVGLGGDAIVGENGGYSGQMSDLKFYNRMLTPLDTMEFFQAGSSATSASAGSGTSSLNPFAKYDVTFTILDNSTQKEIKSYAF